MPSGLLGLGGDGVWICRSTIFEGFAGHLGTHAHIGSGLGDVCHARGESDIPLRYE